jgi:hypothetical protein
VALITLRLVPAVPLKSTSLTFTNFVPFTVIVSPTLPDVGVKLATVGAPESTVNA